MNNYLTIILSILIPIFGFGLITFRSLIKKADSVSRFQISGKNTNPSIHNSGVYIEHGMVYDLKTNKLSAHHKKSQLFYETVL